MGVQTAEALRQRHRAMDRRAAAKWRVLAEMRGGACLYCGHVSGRAHWSLSTGDQVDRETAANVIADGHVVPVGGALGPWAASQTYRWTDLA
jgi:hypothetical protein